MTFVDELPQTRSSGYSRAATLERVAELKAHPGKWAKWPKKTSPSVLRKSLARHGTFEIRLRKGAPYVRFVGEPTAPPARGRTTCPECQVFVRPRFGETQDQALARHAKDRPLCRSALEAAK